MATNIYISKIKVRRGTNEERKHTIFDQGELVSTTDTKRLYVGTGVLSGGHAVSSKIHPPITKYNSLTSVIAEVGDLIMANSGWYQLTASPYTEIENWGDVKSKISQEFTWDSTNTLNIALSSISAIKIDPNTVSNGLHINNGILELNYNTDFFELSSSTLTLKNDSITEFQILSSSLGDGLSGGNGEKLFVKINPTQLYFDDGTINVNYDFLSSYSSRSRFFQPISAYNALSSVEASIGDITSHSGFFYQLTAANYTLLESWANIGQRISTNFDYNSANELVLETLGSATDSVELPKVSYDKHGRITDTVSSIYDTLTGNSSLNGTNSLSSIFNGNPSHSITGAIPGIEITKFEAISSNGVSSTTITLSSAGFLSFEGGGQTRTGKNVGRFAIPIFTY